MQSKKRKMFYQIFVWKPWGFVVFLLLGLGIFFFVTISIQIPVYMTMETMVVKEKDCIQIDLYHKTWKENTPIFLYNSRDDHLEKITEYKIENNSIFVDFVEGLSEKQIIYADIQTDEISLLKHIFIEGGNN